ncbi:hypothetical protein EJB05_21715 [Eragrostis curvula]|uniref:DUF4005 domain-containing protein n=1 Tax=Eragrostis curvula TaxID=38414 RepID=A0A5J9V3N3_9POAL|nr:hypothetical protein EJB05_21715 [Eragrostis curvula]
MVLRSMALRLLLLVALLCLGVCVNQRCSSASAAVGLSSWSKLSRPTRRSRPGLDRSLRFLTSSASSGSTNASCRYSASSARSSGLSGAKSGAPARSSNMTQPSDHMSARGPLARPMAVTSSGARYGSAPRQSS